MKKQKKTSKNGAKKNLKLRDLKPKKDAKGGVSFTYGNTGGTYTSQQP